VVRTGCKLHSFLLLFLLSDTDLYRLRSASKGAQAPAGFGAVAGGGYRVNKRDDQAGGSSAQQWY
jgi:hypothetical protein